MTRRCLAVLVLGLVVGACAAPARAQDRVYEYATPEGPVFTNAGNRAVAGTPLAVLALPPLASVDFAKAPPQVLRTLDAQVVQAVDALQQGPQCRGLTDPARHSSALTILFRQHGADLAWIAGLLGAAFLSWRGLRGHPLRPLFAACPLLASASFAQASVSETQATLASLASGAEACAVDLPPGDAASSEDVQSRLEVALHLQQDIDEACARQARIVDALFADARR